MINPVDGTTAYYPASPQQVSATQGASVQDASAHSGQGDTVTISADAVQKAKMNTKLTSFEVLLESSKKADAENPGSKWKLITGLKQGTFTLKNGNEQKISIDGDSLEILEFKNGSLVKSVKGTINENGASLNTEYYDESGKVRQAIHTDILEMEDAKGWTNASMIRSAQWFEDGRLAGEMQDSMLLSTWNSGVDGDGKTDAEHILSLLNKGSEEVVPSVEALTMKITMEKHIAAYHADVREYGLNGKIVRDMTIDNEGRYKQLSNRSDEDVGNMPARSTREMEHETALSVSIRDYDKDGKLLREASFSDSQKDEADKLSDGKTEQTMSVSWYNKGELVKRSYGSMTLHEVASAQLSERPGLLETLGLSTEGYLSGGPQSAMDLVSKQYLQSSADREFFVGGVNRLAGKNAYSTAEGIAEYGNPDQPYSIDWTDELYRDGELVMRQKDTEKAQEKTFYQKERGIMFRKGHGLTENDRPVVLRETSHEREDFVNGTLDSRQSMKARETLDISMDGPDKLVTSATITQGPEGKEKTTAVKMVGELTQIDSNSNAAAKGLAAEVELMLDELRETTGSMYEDEVSRQAALYVRLDYKSLWDD